jgi:glucose-6-phosphate 1-dehydrogenase
MFQNHLLQLMMVTAMESPVRFNADMVRDEKVKVLQAVRSMRGGDFANDGFRGQYEGYRNEEGVPPDSETETFAALKFHIDNLRWKGVPFYCAAAKRCLAALPKLSSNSAKPPHMLFGERGSLQTICQPLGNSDPTSRRYSALFPNQDSRCGNEDAAEPTRLPL